ncbi:MAG: hypothetical protein ACI81T_001464 [Bacteroidia bacterium]|jgi:hypothetical protein
MKKQIFVIDVVWTGHIPSFHKMIVKGFLDLGYSVVSLSPNPESVEQYVGKQDSASLGHLKCFSFSEKALNKSFPHQFFERFAHKGSFFRKQFSLNQSKALWRQAKNLIAENSNSKKTFVFFPYSDYGFQNPNISASWIERNFPYEWSVLNITPHQLTGDSKNIYLSKNCQSLSILDERLLDKLAEELKKPIHLFPEIVHKNQSTISTKLTNQILEKANGRKLVVLAGVISSSKKLITLLETAKLYESKQNSPLFVIVGEFFLHTWPATNQVAIQKLIQEAGVNVFMHLHRIESEGEFNKLYEIADIIYAVYHNFDKSSNTLSKACLFQKPILVAEGKYLIAERVKRFNLGMTINENSVEECVNAIDAILDLSEQELSESGFDDYLLKNSEQKLVEILGKVFS